VPTKQTKKKRQGGKKRNENPGEGKEGEERGREERKERER